MSSSKARRSSKTSAKASTGRPRQAARTAPPSLPEVVIGRLVGFDEAGCPLVDYPGNPKREPLPALATAAHDESALGRDVALLFADGDPLRPLVVGLLRRPRHEESKSPTPGHEMDRPQEAEARVDGKRVVLTGEQEIVLKCGRASITLTRAGKVLVRGAYLLSRSSGANRIKGGSVQIN